MFTNDSQKPEGDLSVKLNPGVLLHRHCYLVQNALINVLYLLVFPSVFFKAVFVSYERLFPILIIYSGKEGKEINFLKVNIKKERRNTARSAHGEAANLPW